MTEAHCIRIASELQINKRQVEAVSTLLTEGATIPFIARYRKERTGSLDETVITTIRTRLLQLDELDKRRDSIIRSLQEQDKLTNELQQAIDKAEALAELEDIYLPYRPKRRTRAMIAKERGLEPLANKLLEQDDDTIPTLEASAYVDPEKGVETIEDALGGARDIIAERVNEDTDTRQRMRRLFATKGIFQCKVTSGKEEEGANYRDYFDWEGPVVRTPSHRTLAMFRGENEGYLKIAIRPPKETALALLYRGFVQGDGPSSEQVSIALEDSYKRLLGPSIETDIRHEAKEHADNEAIRVFAKNLKETLMAPPLGQKRVLAIDPGYRTGCKTVCLDRQGNPMHNTTIYPTLSEQKQEEAAETIRNLVNQFEIEAIAIGNGTASRETEALLHSLNLPPSIPIILVNESGASVYSASNVARDELPDYDITIRGAISIGRRLMDPLAELVKIDPKSIGVGQYQHDVDHNKLKNSLDDVVTSCVNNVGVDINTASKQLLTYVSGLGPTLAKNIVEYRNQNGAFSSRGEFKKVARMGPKAIEQSAGFLRIPDAANPLDSSAVHPESYHIVNRMAQDLGYSIQDLLDREDLRQQIDLDRYVDKKVGLPTLTDILEELVKPGRDPRKQFDMFCFSKEVSTLNDLEPGMRLPGIVTNVTNFGAFVDIGVHQDGLIHISEISDEYVRYPSDVLKVNDRVTVTVLQTDTVRKRIALSMRQDPATPKNAGKH
ncbi:MAG: Tex family protein [Chloroflexota bacterium]|nr:Tex family protein [Chloroflexota bacterium]